MGNDFGDILLSSSLLRPRIYSPKSYMLEYDVVINEVYTPLNNAFKQFIILSLPKENCRIYIYTS